MERARKEKRTGRRAGACGGSGRGRNTVRELPVMVASLRRGCLIGRVHASLSKFDSELCVAPFGHIISPLPVLGQRTARDPADTSRMAASAPKLVLRPQPSSMECLWSSVRQLDCAQRSQPTELRSSNFEHGRDRVRNRIESGTGFRRRLPFGPPSGVAHLPLIPSCGYHAQPAFEPPPCMPGKYTRHKYNDPHTLFTRGTANSTITYCTCI